MKNYDIKELANEWSIMFSDLIDKKKKLPLIPYQPTISYQVKQEPAISIIFTTMRVGGFDVVLKSLSEQTFKNFELVIVDGLYKYRKGYANLFHKYSFPIKYVPPIKNVFPISSLAHCTNSAFVYASAPIVLMITDYTYLPRDCVEKHFNFHQYHPENNVGYMCPHQYRSLPELSNEFPKKYGDHDHFETKYENEDIEKYVSDLESGKLNSCMWSIFKKDFNIDPETLPLDAMGNADTKLFQPYGPGDQNAFNGKNESLKMEAILEVNGWDEELDGAHLCQDNAFADCLAKRMNFEWIVDKNNKVYIINPRFIMPHAKRIRHHLTNYPIWRKKEANNWKDPVNDWSLKEYRIKLTNPIKLNLGSGYPDGLNVLTMDHQNWKHIDSYEECNPTECYDITKGIKEKDNSVDEIFMGDFLEHLMRLDALYVLGECYRVMKPGAKITICVPDMTAAMKKYLETDGKELGHCNLIWGQQDEINRKNCLGDTHKFGYTQTTLTQFLSSIGFREINRINLHKIWFELTIEGVK